MQTAFIAIPGGTFVMGKDGSRKDEGPAHEVTIAAFRAAISPVTNAEYARFVAETGAEPAVFANERKFAEPEQPVVCMSWHDATAYCNWLGSTLGVRCRLPTEAEREWAALGGLVGGDWPWESEHPGAAAINAFDRPHAPAVICANGYGLRCMAENVHEWCSDWYDAAYYAVSPTVNPRGPADGTRRVSRGGSWRHREKFTRVNARSSLVPTFRYSDFGFRVYADA